MAHLLAWAAGMVFCAILPAKMTAQTELTTVRQIRALTPEQAAEARPVHLRGLVTVLPASRNSFYFLDETGGISIDCNQAKPELKPGQRVELRGVTTPGSFAPEVAASEVRVLGEGTLPPAPLMRLDDLVGGQRDAQWISVQGVVRSASVQTLWNHPRLVLQMDIGVGNLLAVHIFDYSQSDWSRLAGAKVRVRGVCGTIVSDRRQFLGLRLLVTSLRDLQVEKPAAADPFALPLQPIDTMMRFGDSQGTVMPVKIHGFVTYCNMRHGIYVQDGNRGLFVRARQFIPLPLGSEVEVVGYPVVGRYSPFLDDAIYRVVGSPKQIEALPATAEKMIEVSSTGSSTAPFDTLVVRMKGTLVEEISNPEEDRFTLKEGKQLYFVRLLGQPRKHLEIAPGAVLQATGICVAQANEAHDVHSFEIVARTAEDIVVLSSPPWWNLKRAGWLVALVLAILSLMGGVWVLHRRHTELHTLAMTDSLTGLYNRRAFFLLAEHQWQTVLRRKSTLLIFFLDIDRFKEINDTMGHKEGDYALQVLADVLRESFRGTDVIARMGGDEFAVVCEASALSQTMIEQRLDATLRQANQVEGRKFELEISVGMLVYDSSLSALSMDELVSQADALMYRQKRQRQENVA
jgi:diguanylate cyclase (GGDEF)-like protein